MCGQWCGYIDGVQGQERRRNNLLCHREGGKQFGMTPRKVEKKSSENSQVGTWLPLLSWLQNVNKAR